MSALPVLTYNGLAIGTQHEMVCLTDLWRSTGSDPSKRPADWARKEGSQFIEFIAETLNMPFEHIWISERGNGGGTWAHWQVAYAYAKYLSPECHAYCNTVLRAHFEGHGAPIATEVISGLLDTKLAPLHDEMREQRRETGELREIVERTDGNVTYMLNASMPRRDFSAKTWKIWRLAIAEFHGGHCPCGCGQKILDKLGNWIDEATEDHWFTRNRNKRTEGWPVLAKDNQRMKNPKERLVKQHAFANFQSNCDLIEQRLAFRKALSRSRRGSKTVAGPAQGNFGF